MAYYDALIAKWAQAPAGTNDQKLTWVNAQTATGAAIRMIVPAYEIYNRTDRTEYKALAAADETAVQRNLAPATVDYSASSSLRAFYLSIFPAGSKTQQNLAPYVATFDTPTIPWWKSAGYPVAITPADLVKAGIIPPT
jgi:hypothetical protein